MGGGVLDETDGEAVLVFLLEGLDHSSHYKGNEKGREGRERSNLLLALGYLGR